MNKHLLLLCAVVGIGSAPLMSQEVSAGITGRVTDPSNSAIVGAAVTAKDLDRGTVWPTKTNEHVINAFPRIQAGDYEERVEAQGFKTFVQERLHIELNQRARLDVPMQVGALQESVSVTADAALLQSFGVDYFQGFHFGEPLLDPEWSKSA